MGYDLHVTRAQRWDAPDGQEIPREEWRALIEDDPELTSDATNGELAAIWRASSGAEGWFDWFAGSIYTTNPEPPTFGKLLDLAARLDAKVQGDEGEIYSTLADWRPPTA